MLWLDLHNPNGHHFYTLAKYNTNTSSVKLHFNSIFYQYHFNIRKHFLETSKTRKLEKWNLEWFDHILVKMRAKIFQNTQYYHLMPICMGKFHRYITCQLFFECGCVKFCRLFIFIVLKKMSPHVGIYILICTLMVSMLTCTCTYTYKFIYTMKSTHFRSTILIWTHFTSILIWTHFISILIWINFISILIWTPFISILIWTHFVSILIWTPFISISIWAHFVSILLWTPLVSLRIYMHTFHIHIDMDKFASII